MGALSGAPVAVPDDYVNLAALLGLEGSNSRLTEGFIQAQTSGITLRFGDTTAPETSAGGIAVDSGGAIGVGPVFSPETAWPLARIWVRETTAAGGATVAVMGVAQ